MHAPSRDGAGRPVYQSWGRRLLLAMLRTRTQRQISAATGVPEQTLSALASGIRKHPTLATAARLQIAGIEMLSWLFADPELGDDHGELADEEDESRPR